MVTPREITEEIKKLPPRQREAALENYKGISIEWEVKFKRADALSGSLGLLQVVTEPPGHVMYPDVIFDIAEKSYPEINILHENAPIWIKGKIKEVKYGGIRIYLELEDIQFKKGEFRKIGEQANIYNNSNIHHGQGDIVIGDKIGNDKIYQSRKDSFLNKFFWQVIVGIPVGLLIIYAAFQFGWNK